MKRFLTLLLSLALPLFAEAQEHFVFTPQSSAQAQFAGYYAALEKGFYAEEGLDVEIVHPFATQSAVDNIREGKCQATTLPLTLAMRTIGGGLPLVNILQTSMNSATVIISRWGDDPLTMHGAKATAFRAGFGQSAKSFVDMMNLDYEWITSASVVNLFIAGAVDVTLGRSFDEYYRILETGIDIPDQAIYRFEDGEYNIQQEGVYMTRQYYQHHRKQADAFARASRRGWEWVADHPEAALDIVMRYTKELRIATNRTLQRLMLQEVLRLQRDHDSGIREFRVRPDMVEKANHMLVNTGSLKAPVTLEEILP
ncbi:MAG: ABC transporter substrate-binding protein [Bacteroidales bacterium]|jgi:NitT/TauT family transport system substrate-binding protein|nr:ABC transporter substrate-binding protein [Bacteroidales bacterium]